MVFVTNRNFGHYIFGSPSQNTLGDYLLLKTKYKKFDGDKIWRDRVAFSIYFLRCYQQTYGELTCAYCGKEHLEIEYPHIKKIPKAKKATIDHFIAVFNGAKVLDIDNLVVACFPCNSNKGSKVYDINTLKYIPEERLETIKAFIERNKNQMKPQIFNMPTIFGEVDKFLASNDRNRWLQDEYMKIYVRKSKRFIENSPYDFFDFASVQVDERYQNQHYFTNFVAEFLKRYPDKNIFVENVLNPAIEKIMSKFNFKIKQPLHGDAINDCNMYLLINKG